MSAAVLENMSLAEQRELYDRLAYQFAPKVKAEVGTKASADKLEFWGILEEALGRRGQSCSQYLDDVGEAKFTLQMNEFLEVIRQGCPLITRKPIRMQVLLVIINCLIEHLIAIGVPAVPRTLMQQSYRASEAVDRQFPGYTQVKLLPRIISLN